MDWVSSNLVAAAKPAINLLQLRGCLLRIERINRIKIETRKTMSPSSDKKQTRAPPVFKQKYATRSSASSYSESIGRKKSVYQIVSYPRSNDEIANKCEHGMFYLRNKNPELIAELVLFAVIFGVGILLLFVVAGIPVQLSIFGAAFLGAGVINSVSDVLAASVRHRRKFLHHPLVYIQWQLAALYFALISVGVTLLSYGIGRNRSNIDLNNKSALWAEVFGGELLPAGLVYFTNRLFLTTNAPGDELRSLRARVEELEGDVSIGIAEGYFLNFLRWVGWDSHLNKTYKYDGVLPDGYPDESIPIRYTKTGKGDFKKVDFLVSIIPLLDPIYFGSDKQEAPIDEFYRSVRSRLGFLGECSIVPAKEAKKNLGRGGFDFKPRSQIIHLFSISLDTLPISLDDEATVSAQENLFVDIPTCLSPLFSIANGKDNKSKKDSGCEDKKSGDLRQTAIASESIIREKRHAQYKKFATQFSNRVAYNLSRMQGHPCRDGVCEERLCRQVLVVEYEGRLEDFTLKGVFKAIEAARVDTSSQIFTSDPGEKSSPVIEPNGCGDEEQGFGPAVHH